MFNCDPFGHPLSIQHLKLNTKNSQFKIALYPSLNIKNSTLKITEGNSNCIKCTKMIGYYLAISHSRSPSYESLKAMQNSSGQKGFTFIEIIIASLILSLLVAAVVQYHASAGAAKGQVYYLKAVQTAKNELEKLRILYNLDKDGTFDEFKASSGVPTSPFLFKVTGPTTIEVPSPIFRVYYSDHSYSNSFLRPMADDKEVLDYQVTYKAAFDGFSDTDQVDRRTFTYFTNDGNGTTDSTPGSGQVDASLTVIDDMGDPTNAEDDLIGNIGWWVENVPSDEPDDTAKCKKITFVLQFYYPGLEWTKHDPEVIVLKSIFIRP